MIKYDELINLGFTDSVISSYLKRGSLVVKDNDYVIQSDRLLVNVMKRALINNLEIAKKLVNCTDLEYQFYFFVIMKDLKRARKVLKKITNKSRLLNILSYFLFKDEMKFNDINNGVLKRDDLLCLYDLINKYVYYHEPDMILFIIKELEEKGQLDFEIFMLKHACLLIPSTSEYIYDATDFKANNVCYDYLTGLERKLLFLIETGDYTNALNILKEISNIYSHPVSLVIIYLLINNLDHMKTFHKLLSLRDYNIIIGSQYSVLLKLIEEKDYYRFVEVVEELITSTSNFSYILEMYNILIRRILMLNETNLKSVLKEITNNSTGKNDDIKLFGKYNLSSISFEIIKNTLLLSDIDIEGNVDYYSRYLNDYNNHNYLSAKRNLNKHILQLKREKKNFKFEYLVTELDILIANEKNLDANKLAERRNKEKAKKAEHNGNITRAIYFMQEGIKYQLTINPFDLAYIGNLYYQLGNYEEAIKYFYKAKELAITPQDFTIFLLCFLKMNNYQEALDVSDEYFDLFGEDANMVHYIKSICYLKLEMYDEADDEIVSIETINAIYHNNFGTLEYERKIIDENRNGGNSEYTFDDYIEFGLLEKEKPLQRRIKSVLDANDKTDDIYLQFIEEATTIENMNIKLEYLLSVMKILFLEGIPYAGLGIIDYINKCLMNNESIVDKEKILRVTNVYNTNFLTINE